MNKTVNINLSGILFHIDEDAYNELKKYLDAIKLSLAKEESKEEIIADIEARIAEIFNEKKQFEDQVISQSEVDAVITIMGQPEDYNVDEETLEEEAQPKSTSTSTEVKKLFRDPTDSYIGGVSSGLGHYFGIDSIWIRIIWVLLVLGSTGAFIFVYVGFWFFVPKAETTADQLAMKGKPINISNITQKAKEEIEAADLKNKTTYAFERLGEILKVILKIIVKLFGGYLILSSTILLLALTVGLFGFSIFNFIGNFWADHLNAYVLGMPMWIGSILIFLGIGIPTFFVLLLGLKIVFKNIKPIGRITSLTLLGLWVVTIICSIIFGILQYSQRSFSNSFSTNENINITQNDTLKISALQDKKYDLNSQCTPFGIHTDENNKKILVFDNTKLFIKTTSSDKAILKITKKSKGSSYENAKERAEKINLKYEIKNNTIYIHPQAITTYSEKFSKQRVELTLFVPNNISLFIDENLSNITRYKNEKGFLPANGNEGHVLQIKNNQMICTTCPPKEDWEDEDWDTGENKPEGIHMGFDDDGDQFNFDIDEKGINIKAKDNNGGDEFQMKINGKGINIKAKEDDNGDLFEMKIDENGVNVNNV